MWMYVHVHLHCGLPITSRYDMAPSNPSNEHTVIQSFPCKTYELFRKANAEDKYSLAKLGRPHWLPFASSAPHAAAFAPEGCQMLAHTSRHAQSNMFRFDAVVSPTLPSNHEER